LITINYQNSITVHWHHEQYTSLLCLNVCEDIHLVFFEEMKVVIATVGWLLAEGIFSLSPFSTPFVRSPISQIATAIATTPPWWDACRRAREHVCSIVRLSTSMHTHTYILKGNARISSVRCTIWTDERTNKRTNKWNGRERESTTNRRISEWLLSSC
jgi:hypothetical protein